MCWPPSEPCLRDCAGGKLPGIGELLPVGEYPQVNLPEGALLVTGGCSEISLENSLYTVPVVKWEQQPLLSGGRKKFLPGQGKKSQPSTPNKSFVPLCDPSRDVTVTQPVT